MSGRGVGQVDVAALFVSQLQCGVEVDVINSDICRCQGGVSVRSMLQLCC